MNPHHQLSEDYQSFGPCKCVEAPELSLIEIQDHDEGMGRALFHVSNSKQLEDVIWNKCSQLSFPGSELPRLFRASFILLIASLPPISKSKGRSLENLNSSLLFNWW